MHSSTRHSTSECGHDTGRRCSFITTVASVIAMHTTEAPRRQTILDPGGVADRLGISRSQAWRLMSDGVIPGTFDIADGTSGKAYLRIAEGDLEAFVDSRKVQPR